MNLYAIIGHPVAHSLSPLMHNTAFELLGLQCRYEAIDSEPEDLRETVATLREKGYSGFNITLPHKEAIRSHLDEVDKDAQIIGAVNTVVRRDNKLVGINTDTRGFLRSLEPFRTRITGSRVLLLGAGGAARAVLCALLQHHQPARVVILNRSLERAEQLALDFGNLQPLVPLSAESLFDDNLQGTVAQAEVVINTTPVGMIPYTHSSPLEETKFSKNQLCMDLIYVPLETKLLKRAQEAGATTVGGLDMFMHQGAESFRLWTGQDLPEEPVRETILQKLKEQ